MNALLTIITKKFLFIAVAISITAGLATTGFLGYKFYGDYKNGQEKFSETSRQLEEIKKTSSEYKEVLSATEERLKKIGLQYGELQSSTAGQMQKLKEEQEKKLEDQQSEFQNTKQALETETAALAEQLEKTKKQVQDINNGSDDLPSETLEKIMAGVVYVACSVRGSDLISAGSGFVLGQSGNPEVFVVTNAHVIQNNIALNEPLCFVSFPQKPNYSVGDDYFYEGVVLRKILKGSVDLAVLKLGSQKSKSSVAPIPFVPSATCPQSDIKIGDKITLIGYPDFGGLSLTVTDGIISGIENGPIYKTSAKIDQGNSGGLAFHNKRKCVVGIPTWAQAGAFEGLGYIQSWSFIMTILQ